MSLYSHCMGNLSCTHSYLFILYSRAPDKVCIFISIITISSQTPMFDHLLESSHRDDSYMWSNIEIGEETTQVALIEVHFTLLILELWYSQCMGTLSCSDRSRLELSSCRCLSMSRAALSSTSWCDIGFIDDCMPPNDAIIEYPYSTGHNKSTSKILKIKRERKVL